MGEERRMSPRFVMNQLIELSFDRESFVPVRGVDISEQGIRCVAGDFIEPYTKVYVMFTIKYHDTESTVRAHGIVTNCYKKSDEDGSYSAGIKLIDLGEAEKNLVRGYIETSEKIS